MIPRSAFVLLSVLATCLAASSIRAEEYIIRDGKPLGRILVPADPGPEFQLAADELALHLGKMTGATLEIAPDPGGALPAGAIRLALDPQPVATSQRDASEQAFLIDQTGRGVLIRGKSPIAVLYGAYEYLSDLGVRWFLPGDIGLHIPKRADLPLDRKRKAVKPVFRQRSIWLNGNVDWHWDKARLDALMSDYAYWAVRNRVEGSARGRNLKFPDIAPRTRDATGHNIHAVLKWGKASLAATPERYPLVTRNGQKVRTDKGQICFTNPANIADAVAFCVDFLDKNPAMLSASMSLSDTAGVCECDACVKANAGLDPVQNCDRLIWGFMNEVARQVGRQRPGKGIAFYSGYGVTECPPPGLKAEPNILGAIAHIDHNNHDLEDKTCPFNVAHLQKFAALKASGAEMMARDYIVYPTAPQPLVILDYIRTYHKLGCIGYSCEVMARSDHHWMVNWAQAQLAWDPTRDPRALIEEYCRSCYGAAGPDVLAVVDEIEASIRRIPKITLGGFGSSQETMTEDVIAFSRKRLAAAAAKVDGVEARRLKRFREDIEFFSLLAEAYRALYRALDDRTPERREAAVRAFDVASAYFKDNGLVESCSPLIPSGWIDRVRNTAVKFPDINPAPNKALLNADDAALRRELFALAPVPDKLDGLFWLPKEWKFRIDIFRRGDAEGWMNPAYDDSRWTTLGYGFFDEQGFARFEGTFWYRVAFDAPALPAGRRLMLRIGALDDEGAVFVNGRLVHERVHIDGLDWKRSFELDVTGFIKPAQSNVLAIRGRNDYGKGGLWKPCALYLKQDQP